MSSSKFIFQSDAEDVSLAPKIQDLHGASQHIIRILEQMALKQDRACKQVLSQMESFRDEMAERQMNMQLEMERIKIMVQDQDKIGAKNGRMNKSSIVMRPAPAEKRMLSLPEPPSQEHKRFRFGLGQQRDLIPLPEETARTAKALHPVFAKKPAPSQDLSNTSIYSMDKEPSAAQDPLYIEGHLETDSLASASPSGHALSKVDKFELPLIQDDRLPCKAISDLQEFMKDTEKVKEITELLKKLEPIRVVRTLFKIVLEEQLWHVVQLPRNRSSITNISGDMKVYLPWEFIDWVERVYTASCNHCGVIIDEMANTANVSRQKLLNFLYERRKVFKRKRKQELAKESNRSLAIEEGPDTFTVEV